MVIAASTLVAEPIFAASGSWSATSSGTWSDAANWDGGTIANGLGFTATFASDIASDATVTLDSNRTLNSVVFGDADTATAGSWVIASATAAPATMERLSLNGGGGAATITVNALGTNATATLSAPLSASNGTFVKDGAGTLILPNTFGLTDANRNMFSVKSAIAGGTLQISIDNALGGQPGSFVADQLTISNGATLRTSGAVTLGPSRGITIGVGGGTLNLSGGNLTYAGRFTGLGETVTVTGTNALVLARNTSNTVVSDVDWDFALNSGSRVFFEGSNGLGTGDITVRNGVRLVSQATAPTAREVINSVTLASGAGLVARTSGGAVTYTNVTFPSGGTVVFNRDDQATASLTISSGGTLTGNLSVDTSQQTTNVVGDVTMSGVFSGTGGLVKTGTGASGRLILSGANTYSGPTTVTTGTLLVNGDQTAATGAVTVASGATLGGSGTVGGGTTIGTGATLSPGTSPGTLSFTQGVTLAAGGNYNWQMLSATGSAGAADAWDLVNVTGSLTIDATSADPFRLNLWTLATTGPDVSGLAANFDPTQSYAWTFASAAGGVTGFAADKFVVNTAAENGTAGFANSFDPGSFAVNLSGNDLQLVFSPTGPTNDIVIDVPSGSQTQAEAGYPLINTANSVTKIGAGAVVFDAANTYTGPTTISAGTLEVTNADSLSATTVTVDTGATLAVGSGTTMKAPAVIVDGGTLSASTLAVDSSTGIASLAINAGTVAGAPVLSVGAGGGMALVQDARVTVGVGGLDVTETSGGGRLDLGAGQVTVAAGGISATDLRADIIAGRNGGAWSGATGIMSSTAAAAPAGTRAVGYFIAGDGTTRVSFAAPGDGDLSGQVNVFDLLGIDSAGKFGTGQPSVWSQGDFNYDGVTNIFDLLAIDTAGAYGAGNYFPAAPTSPTVNSVAAVPEPAGFAILLGGAGLAWLLGTQRRVCRDQETRA